MEREEVPKKINTAIETLNKFCNSFVNCAKCPFNASVRGSGCGVFAEITEVRRN